MDRVQRALGEQALDGARIDTGREQLFARDSAPLELCDRGNPLIAAAADGQKRANPKHPDEACSIWCG
jgi:hypothetical protein